MRRLRHFLRDQSGATLVETTIVFSLVMILTFGVVEFGNALWQYHGAEKATAIGARWLATRAGVAGSDLANTPLTTELYTAATPDCFVSNPSPSTLGTPCSQVGGATGWTQTCSGTGGGSCSATEMAGLLAQMQQYAPTLKAANISVQLSGSPMGFLGRGRAIPMVTVRTTGLTYNWVAIGALLGLPSITMPSFASTLPAEDQKEGPGI